MPYRNRKSLVLGAGGFLGRHFCAYFAERGWPCIAVGREGGDLTDAQACDAVFRKHGQVDRIFHFATFQRTGFRQLEIPADLLLINACMHLNILSAWAKHAPEAKLVSTGSSCFYPESDDPIPETQFQAGPLHESVRYYGLAKSLLALGSDALAQQHKLKYLHCVLATMYGPHDHLEPDRSHFVAGMVRRALEEQGAGGTTFTVWGAPDTVRECLHVRDQIEAILSADQHFENRILNCAANQPVTIDTVARTLVEVLAWSAPIVYTANSFKGTSRKSLDSTVFLKATGWAPRISLRDGLADLVGHLRGAAFRAKIHS